MDRCVRGHKNSSSRCDPVTVARGEGEIEAKTTLRQDELKVKLIFFSTTFYPSNKSSPSSFYVQAHPGCERGSSLILVGRSPASQNPESRPLIVAEWRAWLLFYCLWRFLFSGNFRGESVFP